VERKKVMDQSKRNLLKVLPIAAMVPSSIALGDTRVASYEVSTAKRYLIVIPDAVLITEQEGQRMRDVLAERGINATVIAGAEGLKVYELDA
jgi:hypothetical protein